MKKYLSINKFLNQLKDNDLKYVYKGTEDYNDKSETGMYFYRFVRDYVNQKKIIIWRYDDDKNTWSVAITDGYYLGDSWGRELRTKLDELKYEGKYLIPEFTNTIGIKEYSHYDVTEYIKLIQWLYEKNKLTKTTLIELLNSSQIKTDNEDDVYKIKYEGNEYKRQGKYSYLTGMTNNSYFKSLQKGKKRIENDTDFTIIPFLLYAVQLVEDLTYDQINEYLKLFISFRNEFSHTWYHGINEDLVEVYRDKLPKVIDIFIQQRDKLMHSEPQWIKYCELTKNTELQELAKTDVPMNIIIDTNETTFN